ncbi:MAG: enoyl-CoA hydratase/isomerase family protein [Acidobacteria bacterium]|nr:enoyl-CoA hydratase/isomerase family protein [Acidobacteriota bacterium]
MRYFETRGSDSFNFREILYEKSGSVATVTLNRPEVYNCYSCRTLEELTTAMHDASFDDAVGVIVVTGAGTRAFSTGGDVKEYAAEFLARPRDYWKYMALFRGWIESIIEAGKPVIARLNGMAVGGGNETHLACDLSVMAQHAHLRQVGTRVGSVACGGATQWLPLVIGDRRAREMLMLNRPVPPRRALEWGLVNRVVASVKRDGAFLEDATEEQIRLAQEGQEGYSIDLSALDAAVQEIAAALLETFPECMRYTKEQTNALKNFVWYSTAGHAREWLALHYACAEPLEGMRAFVEKRRPDYAGLRRRAIEDTGPEFPWGAYVAQCPRCGATCLPERFRYCGQCGVALPGAAGATE